MKTKRKPRIDSSFTSQYSHKGSATRDPLAQSQVATPVKLTLKNIDDLYKGNWLCRNLIDIPAEDMTRSWCNVIIPDDPELQKRVELKLTVLNARSRFHDMCRYESLYGDGCIAIGINDGVALEHEVQLEGIESIKFLHSFGKPAIKDIVLNEDLFGSDHYGEADKFILYGNEPIEVHASRVLHLQTRGFSTDKFGVSVYQPMMQLIKVMDSAEWSVGQIIYSMIFKVLKVKQLPTPTQHDAIIKQLEQELNALTCVLMRDDEEFSFESPMGAAQGMGSLLDFLWDSVSGASRVPKAFLLGQRQGGLTGAEWDSRTYFSRISALQNNYLKELVEYLVKLILLSKEVGDLTPDELSELEYCVEFNPLFSETASERAERMFKEAQAHAIYMDRQVVADSEVREQLDWVRGPGPMTQLLSVPEEPMPENPDDVPANRGGILAPATKGEVPTADPPIPSAGRQGPGGIKAPGAESQFRGTPKDTYVVRSHFRKRRGGK